MQTAGDRNATTVADYIASVDEDRRDEFSAAIEQMRDLIPDGYDEAMTWGFPTWEVPLDVSGPTYNKKPLMFAGLAAQKNHFGLYIMCAYMSEDRKARLAKAWKATGKDIDMGKACIRFQATDDVPWDAVGEEIDVEPAEFTQQANEARESALKK